MFWVVLFLIIITAMVLDQFGILDKKPRVVDKQVIIKGLFKQKVIDISSISEVRMLLNDKGILILLPGVYGHSVIQVKSSAQWETVIRVTLLNHKRNSNFVNKILESNPDIGINNALKEYIEAPNIGDYFINKKQVYRGLLLILIIAVLVLISYLF